jgi:hypothetical protein
VRDVKRLQGSKILRWAKESRGSKPRLSSGTSFHGLA